MNRLLPNSLLGLLVFALLVVALPLLAALVIAIHNVERLSHSGLEVAVEAEAATEAGRRLWDAIANMERNGLQYLAIQDDALLEAYQERHMDFMAAVRDLRPRRGIGSSEELEILSARGQILFERLRNSDAIESERQNIESELQELSRRVRALVEANSLDIWRSANLVTQQADTLNQTLLHLTIISIAATIGLVALFVALIQRPLRKLDRAIRNLGASQLDSPIRIDRGTADLQELGGRLDWLRLRLREIDAERSAFLRTISHELKTPLAAVREGAALIRDDVEIIRGGEQYQIAGIVLENAIRLQRLIENLLQINAARFAGSQRQRVSLDLRTVVERVLADHALSRATNQLGLETDLSPGPVVGDPEQLRAAIDNLVSNAVKFSPRGTTLKVSLASAGSQTVFDIQDTGPGIDPGERERIFELFYQGCAQAAGPINGSGLGLAITREFVEAHGGCIELLPSTRGAHFRITLPRETQVSSG